MTWRAVLALGLLIGGAVVFVGFPEHLQLAPELPASEAGVRLRAMGQDYGSVVPEELGRKRLAERGRRSVRPAVSEKAVVAVALDLK